MKPKLISLLIFVVAALAHADDATRGPAGDFKISQFPSERWDGNTIQYLIYVNFPKMDGRTLQEAEKIRKFFVTQSIRKGIELLFRLTTYDSTGLSFEYSTNDCNKVDSASLTPTTFPRLDTAKKKLLDRCKTEEAARPRKGAALDENSYDERDLKSQSYDDVLNFGEFISKNHIPFQAQSGQTSDIYVDMDASGERNAISSIFYASKDKDGKDTRLLNVVIPEGVAATGTGRDESTFDVNETQGFYRNIANMQGYSIRYMIPNAGLGAIMDSTGSPSKMELIVPNRKLIALFHEQGPNVTAAMMKKAQQEIEKKLNPFGLHLGSTAMNGGLAGLVREDGDESGGKSSVLKCIKSVDVRKCSHIWAYWALASAKIESERNKSDPNKVFIQVSIPMQELQKVAVPYANYMAK